MLNATWLETFTTLGNVGNYTETARRLNMTQPGVSQHVRKLEAQLGQPLVTRVGKGFVLTPAGEALRQLGHARRREEAALRRQIEADDPRNGAVRIGCSGSLAMLLYPAFLTRLAESPDLTLSLEAAPMGSIVDAVAEGRLDLGVVSTLPDTRRLTAEFIGREELCLALPAGFGAAAPAFDDLQQLGFIDHPDGAAYAEMLLAPNYPGAFTDSGTLRRRGAINQIGQILAPVATGIGYSDPTAQRGRELPRKAPAPRRIPADPRRAGYVLTAPDRPLAPETMRVVHRRDREEGLGHLDRQMTGALAPAVCTLNPCGMGKQRAAPGLAATDRPT